MKSDHILITPLCGNWEYSIIISIMLMESAKTINVGSVYFLLVMSAVSTYVLKFSRWTMCKSPQQVRSHCTTVSPIYLLFDSHIILVYLIHWCMSIIDCYMYSFFPTGLSAPDPDSIHIDLTPRSTSYETGVILDQSTSIVSALRTLLVTIRTQGPIMVMWQHTCHSLVHSLVSEYPIRLALDTVWSRKYNNAFVSCTLQRPLNVFYNTCFH